MGDHLKVTQKYIEIKILHGHGTRVRDLVPLFRVHGEF